MPVVTMDQFEKRLSKHRGTLVATFVTRTRVKMRKKHPETKESNPWPLGVERVAVRGFMLGARYENSVNLQRERDGKATDFKAQPLWVSKAHPEGEGEHDTPFTVRHRTKGTRYFYVKPTNLDEHGNPVVYADRYIDVATNMPIHPDDVKAWLLASKHSEIAWRVVEMSNVEQIRTFGEVFDIIPNIGTRDQDADAA